MKEEFTEAFFNWIKPLFIKEIPIDKDNESINIEEFKEDLTTAIADWVRPIFLANNRLTDSDFSSEQLFHTYVAKKEKEILDLKAEVKFYQSEMIDKISQKISEIKVETDIIKNNQKTIITTTQEAKNEIQLLKETFINLTKSQKKSIEDVLESLNNVDEKNLEKEISDSAFRLRIDEMLGNIESNQISKNEKSEIKNELNRTDISVKHKMQFIIPLIFLNM